MRQIDQDVCWPSITIEGDERVGGRIGGVDSGRAFEELYRLPKAFLVSLCDKESPPPVELKGFDVVGITLGKSGSVFPGQCGNECRRHPFGDRVLHNENVREVLIERIRPHRRAVIDPKELDGHADRILVPLHGSL